MKKFLIVFALMCVLFLVGCSDTDDAVSDASFSISDELDPEDVVQPDEVIEDRDLTADDYAEEYDDPGYSTGLATVNEDCDALAGVWVLNTYTTHIESPAGSISNVHNNSGKTLKMQGDCTYVEDYSTEGFVPARLVQSYIDRGMDISQVNAFIGGNAEDIVCSYEGMNTGVFEVDPSGNGFNVVQFMPDAVNQISGSCNQNVGGAMKIDGTTYTPGVGNTAVKHYEYLFENGGNKMILRSAFIPETGTEITITMVFTK